GVWAMDAGSFWSWIRWWPVSRKDQMLVAQALGEVFDAGLDVDEALRLVSLAHPRSRMRQAIGEVRQSSRNGYSLPQSFERTGLRFDPGILAVLKVGEQQGCLADELFAFAKRFHPDPSRALRRAIGRPSETTRFAAALGRLLRHRSLTVEVIES